MTATSAPQSLESGGLDPWRLDVASVAHALGTDRATGLGAAEADARLARIGPNVLRAKAVKPAWRLFVEQFTNAMILVLIGAAGITAAIGDFKDTVVILAIVALNGIVGFVQEYRAEKAMDALKSMTSPSARVVRDSETMQVPATELVPGDLVRLEAGDIVTADLRLVEAHSMRINEAALTGESEPAGLVAPRGRAVRLWRRARLATTMVRRAVVDSPQKGGGHHAMGPRTPRFGFAPGHVARVRRRRTPCGGEVHDTLAVAHRRGHVLRLRPAP